MPPRAQRFEELIVWQKARSLRIKLVRLVRAGKFHRDYSLADQIRRAATSVMANVAEGFERKGPREFAHHLSLARGSAGELRSHLYAALDSEFLSPEEFEELSTAAEEVSRILLALRVAVLRSAPGYGTPAWP